MKILSIASSTLLLIALVAFHAFAESAEGPVRRPMRDWPKGGPQGRYREGFAVSNETAAGMITYCLVKYDFEPSNWQGWTKVDNTAQQGSFIHVDNFAGLGGGSYGRLQPIEGTKSMWCGVRPNPSDPYLCHFKNLPGYGNQWNQVLRSVSFDFAGPLTLSYHGVFDCEPNRDFAYVEYDAGDGNWKRLASYTGVVNTVASLVLYPTQATTKLRFLFTSDDRKSDEESVWNGDGAFIIDSIRVADSNGEIHFSNFESVEVGGQTDYFWYASSPPGFGIYSGLKQNLSDKDPFGANFSTQVVFFIGSPYPSMSYPGLYDTPFCTGWDPGNRAPCQDEMVMSPVIDMKKYSTACNNIQDAHIPPTNLDFLGGATLEFDVYRDLPATNLVFYEWHIRNIDDSGCPGPWLDRRFLYYGSKSDFFHSVEDVSSLVGDDRIQIALGMVDMCSAWGGRFGICTAHTPTPWFDNVAFYRFTTAQGPQWWYSDIDLFQDNFPYPSLLGWVRADCSADINPFDSPTIRPGDSIVVEVTSNIGGGIAQDYVGGPAVYMHVRCHYMGTDPLKPLLLFGPMLQGTYGIYKSDDATWTTIQGDTARTQARIVEDKYMFDLNDSLLANGYIVEYYFTAMDNEGNETALPSWARSTGPYFEFTCLPTLNSDVLFVDDYSGIGSFAGTVEDYWTSAFEAVLPEGQMPDRYDVNGPSSFASNGLASRAEVNILMNAYKTIIWDSGDLDLGTISDGTMRSDKSNDCELLNMWMTYSQHDCGLWICGDDVASDLASLASPQALTLLNTWCGVSFITTSYYGVTGGSVVNPRLVGDADLSLFFTGGLPDTCLASGGDPLINEFDCLEKTANGKYAMRYPAFNSWNYYAAIGAENVLEAEDTTRTVRTMWFGQSLQYLRDERNVVPIDVFRIVNDVMAWMATATNPDITKTENAPMAYGLSQNYPNPCNPFTTIKLDMKEKGTVAVKIYNVAGQLVRTLHDGVLGAGHYTLVWDGRNNRGAAVASGVYFYKMDAKSFSKTRKLVMIR